MTRPCHLLVVAACLALALPARAEQDPMWRWRTIETDHFQIHYYEGLDRIARRVAAIAEQAHANLTADLGWEPRRITHLVLVDDTDYAQGITYVSAQNVIRLWVVPPEDTSTLEDFDDWLRLLVTHEYTHLVHIDQARGLPAVINAIFGQVYHPLQFTPPWLTEGYSVHEESRQTTGGRVRSTMFDMYLRMAVLDDEFLRLDQVTSGTRRFPQGNVAYLYGQDFVNYVARRFGDDVLARLAREMGDDVLPYGLNRSFRRVTGFTAIELWDDWHRSLDVGYRAWAAQLREDGLTASRQLTTMGERMGPPRFGPDGRTVFFYSTGEDSPPAVWAIDASGTGLRRVAPMPGDALLAPTADGRALIYARGDQYRIVYQYQDLFRLDLRTGEEERLTEGVRATAVDVAADGRALAYTAFRQDSSDLWVADGQLGHRRRLIESPEGEQVYSPRFSPDGRTLAVSVWRRGGYRDLELVDVETGQRRRLTNDRALDTGPCFTPDGRWVVFASDRTGISNLYAYDLQEDRLRQVTNVLGGAYNPDVAPDGESVVFAGFSSRGFDLHVMPFDPTTFRDPRPVRPRPDADPRDEPPAPRMRERRYSPWSTLAPRSWMLGLGSDAYGQALTLTAFGEDAAATHRIGTALTVGLERGDVGYDLSYEYRRFRPTITLRHARWTAPRESFRLDTASVPYVEETLLFEADVSVQLQRGIGAHRLWAGYELQYARATTDLTDQAYDPGGRPPRFPASLGLFSGVRFGWSFSNSRSSVRAISPEAGRSISTSVTLYHPAFGSDSFQVTFRYRWSEYILMPWRHHHVLALSLGGGISAGGGDAFYLGGYPEQDLLTSLINQAPLGGTYLRGYTPGVIGGSQYHLLNAEYRFPLWAPERGVSTLPIYLSHLWLAVFCDVGGAFARDLDVDELLVGVGGELLIRVVIGYQLPFTFRIGYARGVMDDGIDQFFAVMGLPF